MRTERSSRPLSFSSWWDLYVPFGVAALPAGLFQLLGILGEAGRQAGGKLAVWAVVGMAVTQVLGIFAMALVVLMRYDRGFRMLASRAAGRPSPWRQVLLLFSIVLVLCFDVLVNVATAFGGAELLLLLALPVFLGYVVCFRLAFMGLP